ncbi:NADH-quinone oxidoreductase subunit NuoK [Flammeovirga yaeyamensis]|uniref:NADH-quinone oxidoreductase subunit K n=1 Tax=Flammeovirga yaeyamensis TaxID=367791 RepID=A0AAX1N906_9BACT|nr:MULTISPECIES: NADH-quinone oxidoreductase subunit NuoK [Flammeovirga]ANQ48785.2 NADH-quinone oxidoreductase subunit NuoK [Flammeovirga sp. MY04]MBB3698865.1 NADH-quinone oxidoreductase subunit K [Flammeovirga yaeyamensis]NMF37450.1 NADH-quinone oxidoreductase subunit NuoK [Flammeovirga yaeyamensis]QWG03737.1 NADH-quinone oxidoreductase subunit NuoK [Flammeovirga yaeyamensis]
MVTFLHYMLASAFLFSIGLAIALTKRSAIVALMGVELMLNAANINLVAFNMKNPSLADGHVFAIFVIVIAAAEVCVALALIIKLFQYFKSVDLHQLNQLKEK